MADIPLWLWTPNRVGPLLLQNDQFLNIFFSGIFSQSNLGICTKMGMTLMPNPGGHESFVSYYLLN